MVKRYQWLLTVLLFIEQQRKTSFSVEALFPSANSFRVLNDSFCCPQIQSSQRRLGQIQRREHVMVEATVQSCEI